MSEQGRITDCAVCGVTTARMANGEKPAKGTGAGWVNHLVEGTMKLTFAPWDARDTWRGKHREAMLCPTCARVVHDLLLGAGVLKPELKPEEAS